MKRSLICLFVFLNMMVLNGTIHSFEHQELLVPLPENPSMVGYLTESKEAVITKIQEGNDIPVFMDVDVRINFNPVFITGSAGLGIPWNFQKFSLFFPFFAGFSGDKVNKNWNDNFFSNEDILVKDGISLRPPMGGYLSGGIFVSSKYFHLGLTNDWFFADDTNKYTSGAFYNFKLHPRIYFDKIPYVGVVLNLLDSFWSFEQLFDTFASETELDDFQEEYSGLVRFEEYSISLRFEDFRLGKTAVTFSTYSHRKYYDTYSKVDMQGANLYFNFNPSFVLFTDIAYRRYFDVILAPEYSNHEDGVYLKAGVLFYTGSTYLRLHIESGRQPWLSSPKINLTVGMITGIMDLTFSGDHVLPNKQQKYCNNIAGRMSVFGN